MVAIVDPNDETDLNTLAQGIDKNLPVYARPLFLRILPKLELTGRTLLQAIFFSLLYFSLITGTPL